MKRLWEWLLDLDRIDLSLAPRIKDELTVQWLEPLDGWLWFILSLIVPVYVFLIYKHEGGTVRSRIIMAGGRALLILFTLLLLCKPAVVHRRDRTEPSTVAILVDQSASMTRSDHYDDREWQELAQLLPTPPTAPRCSRWELAKAILSNSRANPAQPSAMLTNLLEKHELRLFRFAGSISEQFDILTAGDVAAISEQLSAENATGQETNIARSIEQVFDACIDAHLIGIVLLTDGQPTVEVDWSKVTSLSRIRGTPIFVIVLGSPKAPKDLAIRDLQADRYVYLGDRAAIKCSVYETGLPEGVLFEVMLRDAVTNELYASRTLRSRGGESSHNIELQFKPHSVGTQNLIVETPPLQEELETDNNAQQLQIKGVDDKIKVLYVDGYPRYEYRYLKNTLLREPSIISSILLLSADRDFPQEGDEPIRRFPRDQQELNEYDVILFGDVDPRGGWISSTQMELIVDFVNRQGGGFGLIAGERYTPQRFYGTPLERIIPVELGVQRQGEFGEAARAPFRPQLTAAGRESALLRLLLDERQAEQAFQRLPHWHWFHAVADTKPGTEVLLQHPTRTHDRDPLPLLVVGRHGAGKTFYQGSDDTWRWRRHRGEGFFDTYWIQVVRYLGRNKKLRPTTDITLRTHQRKINQQTPVVISLEFEEAAQSLQLPDNVSALIRSAAGIRLGQTTLTRLTADSKHFQGSYLPTITGQLEIVFDPERYALDFPRVSTLVEVQQQSLENRIPQANLQLMSELAEKTGGSILKPWWAASVHQQIPDRQYVIPDDITETIWDSKLALVVFVILITTEWILRKLNGLT